MAWPSIHQKKMKFTETPFAFLRNRKRMSSITRRTLSCFCVILLESATLAQDGSKGTGTRLLTVWDDEVQVPIADVEVIFEIGQKLDLFQVNRRFFVAVMTSVDGDRILCAVPRISHGEWTAWITNEKRMIFGQRTASCDGFLLLTKGDKLSIISEYDKMYTALVERNGHRMPLNVPKRLSGLREEATLDARVSLAARKNLPALTGAPVMATSSRPPSMAAVAAVTGKPSERMVSPLPIPVPAAEPTAGSVADEVSTAAKNQECVMPSDQEDPPVLPGGVVQHVPLTLEQLKAGAPDPAAVTTDTVEKPQAVTVEPAAVTVDTASNSPPATPAPEPVGATQAEPGSKKWSELLSRHAMMFQILLGVCIVEGWFIVRMQKKRTVPSVTERAALLAATAAAPGEAALLKTSAGNGSALSGSLESLSMPQVIQFLYTTQESGTLEVSETGRPEAYRILFHKGQIVDAMSGDQRGEALVGMILGIRHATFTFRRENHEACPPNIAKDTMTVLLDATRLIDEAQGREPQTV